MSSQAYYNKYKRDTESKKFFNSSAWKKFRAVVFARVTVNLAEYKTEEQKRKFYKSGEWNKLRLKALERDNHECQQCKREGRVHVDSVKVEGERKSVELNMHHKYEIEDYPQLAFVLDNLETLCLNCHNKIHDRVFGETKKKKWDDEMW